MNKNQKHLPYTYTQLIKGNRVSALDCQEKARQAKEPAVKDYWNRLLDELNDEFARLSLAQASCGDGTVLIR